MLRTRLAALALTGGLCLLSGCNGFSFFNRSNNSPMILPSCPDCGPACPGCETGVSSFDGGPVLAPDAGTFVPSGNPTFAPTPVAGAPRLIPTPLAPNMPYQPGH